MIIVPILEIALGVAVIVLSCVFLAKTKYRKSPKFAQMVTLLGLAAAGIALWTLHLKK
jgi:hypothetical protein